MENRCVSCGAVIPEGGQVCGECLEGGEKVNKEGYRDPTAEMAVRRASRMPKRIKDVVRALNQVISIHGLEIVVVRDKRTGREWGEL